MNVSRITGLRFTAALVAVAVLAAIGVATAGAEPRLDGAPALSTGPAYHLAPPVHPDDRAGIRGLGSSAAASRTAKVDGGSGFDWADASVGAGAAFCLILFGWGVFVVGFRRRRQAAPQHTAAQLQHG